MSAIDISTLPISKIKSALKDLGLSGSGTKKELIERYNEYMKNPEKSVASENAGKEAEVAMDHESVSNVAVKEESAIMKEGAEKSGAVQESGSNGKVVATEAPAVEAVSAEAAAAAPEAVPNAASEAVPNAAPEAVPNAASEAVPTEAAPVETAPTETAPTETAPTETAPTESTSIKSTTTTSPTIDIDAELARREERAKRFGGAFDREQCREQLLKQQQQVAAVSLRETRRARFGASDAEKKQQREARFGATKANAESVDDAVKAARIAKFGQVDMSRFERKRSQPLARGRKSRRFH
ncbi:hypothetical protein WA588_005810 [Blastocystis sp. NMH]